MSQAPAAAGGTPSAVFACDVCGQCPVQDFVYRCSVCRVWGARRLRIAAVPASRPARRADSSRPRPPAQPAATAVSSTWTSPARGGAPFRWSRTRRRTRLRCCARRCPPRSRRRHAVPPRRACLHERTLTVPLRVLLTPRAATAALRTPVGRRGQRSAALVRPPAGATAARGLRWQARAKLTRRRSPQVLRNAAGCQGRRREQHGAAVANAERGVWLPERHDAGAAPLARRGQRQAQRAHARPFALLQARYWRSVAQSRGARRLDGVYDRLP